MQLYRQVARHNGGEPDAGRRLVGWARAAGFASVTASASAWCFADRDDLDWWSGTWADRLARLELRRAGGAPRVHRVPELDGLAQAWRSWAQAPDAWFAILHGELICRRSA